VPILDLQQRLVEVGRIRLGTSEEATSRQGKKFRRPVKLDTFRLTSRDEQRIRAAADLYGGAPAPWRDGEWEIITETETLDVLVIPGQALSQFWETWEGGECKRRCDGVTEHLTDRPCLCPDDYGERQEAAKDGKACKPTTRLSVVLPRLPGIGQWRLEAHGFYAAVELAAAAQILEEASRRGALLPARLRVEQRTARRGGQTHNYRVPVLDLDVSVAQLHELAAGEVPDGYQPVTVGRGPSVGEALDAAQAGATRPRRQGRTAAEIGPAAPAPTTAPIGDGDTPAEPLITEPQRKLLFAAAKEHDVARDDLKRILTEVTGQDSSAAVPARQFDELLATVRGELVPAARTADRG